MLFTFLLIKCAWVDADSGSEFSSKLNLTSFAVSSTPSWNLTPFLRVNVQVSPSGLISHLLANPSSGENFPSGLQPTKESYNKSSQPKPWPVPRWGIGISFPHVDA